METASTCGKCGIAERAPGQRLCRECARAAAKASRERRSVNAGQVVNAAVNGHGVNVNVDDHATHATLYRAVERERESEDRRGRVEAVFRAFIADTGVRVLIGRLPWVKFHDDVMEALDG